MNRARYFIEDMFDLGKEMRLLLKRFVMDHTELTRERVRNWMDKEIDHGDCPGAAPKAKEKGAEWTCSHGVLFRAQKVFGSKELKWVPRKEEG